MWIRAEAGSWRFTRVIVHGKSCAPKPFSCVGVWCTPAATAAAWSAPAAATASPRGTSRRSIRGAACKVRALFTHPYTHTHAHTHTHTHTRARAFLCGHAPHCLAATQPLIAPTHRARCLLCSQPWHPSGSGCACGRRSAHVPVPSRPHVADYWPRATRPHPRARRRCVGCRGQRRCRQQQIPRR